MKFVDVTNDIAFRKIFGNEQKTVFPENADDEGLIEAYKDADKHSWKKEELIAYDNASIAEQDARGRLVAAEKKGQIAGKLEEKQVVIKQCLAENMSPKMIAKIVRLPLAEVKVIIEALSQ